MKKSYLVLGCGRVGKALCLSLKKKNKEVYLWDRDLKKAKNFSKKYKIHYLKKFRDFEGNFIIFAIKDDFIKEIAKKVSKEIKAKGIAIHTSGIYNDQILSPLEKKGFKIGKCHPIYAFPEKEIEMPEGLTFGVQSKKNSLKEIKEFIRLLGCRYLIIPKGEEEIYHLSLSIGSNFTAFLFYLSMRIFKENFKEKETLRPLFIKTVENVLDYGIGGITGPHIRKDNKTIRKHLRIIKEKYPSIIKIYNLLRKEINKISS